MKVRDLIEEIEKCKAEYPDFLNWDIYTEQLDEVDKQSKKSNPQWKWFTDSEGWEYCECFGFWTRNLKERAFTINVNY